MNDAFSTVCVLGLGYIGLPTASVLATHGFQVLGVDVAPHIVDTVNAGAIHIEEPGLQTVVCAAIQSGKLRAALHPERADVFIIAVPTPLTAEKKADMRFVIQAAESIVPHLKRGTLVILESTSPPGTCRDLIMPILERSGLNVGGDVHLAYCPERVLPGRILTEFIANDRIIGGINSASAERARALYERFVEGRLFVTDATTAEMDKLLENTFSDVNIALANEAALICERMGVCFWEAARLANRHPRVTVHDAGPGVGGHCISVDPWFLVEKAAEESQLIRLARERNDAMPRHVADAIAELVDGMQSPRIAVLGLAYKANVDDIRESPAVRVVHCLLGRGFEVAVHDPHVRHSPFPLLSLEQCLHGSDCVALLTNHDEFKAIEPRQAAAWMRHRVLYDTRNLFDVAAWKAAGFRTRLLGAGAQ